MIEFTYPEIKNELNKQGVAPILVAVFNFPDGSVRYLSDREHEYQTGKVTENLVKNWGTYTRGGSVDDAAEGIGLNISSVSLEILNIGPDYFYSDIQNSGDPQNIKVELRNYFDGVYGYEIIDLFLVQDNLTATQGSLTINIDLVSLLLSINPYVGTVDPVTNNYIGVSVGIVEQVPGVFFGTNPIAKVNVAPNTDDATVYTDRDLVTAGFPTSGTIEIGITIINYTGISGNNFTGCTGVTDHDTDVDQYITLVDYDYIFAFGAGPVEFAGPVFINGVQYDGDNVIDVTSNPVTVTFPERLPNTLTTYSENEEDGILSNPIAKLASGVTVGVSVLPCDRDLITAGFPTSGILRLSNDTAYYSGISGNDFTGCTGVGQHDAGTIVQQKDVDHVFVLPAGTINTDLPPNTSDGPYNGEYEYGGTLVRPTVTFPDRLPYKTDYIDAEYSDHSASATWGPDDLSLYSPITYGSNNFFYTTTDLEARNIPWATLANLKLNLPSSTKFNFEGVCEIKFQVQDGNFDGDGDFWFYVGGDLKRFVNDDTPYIKRYTNLSKNDVTLSGKNSISLEPNLSYFNAGTGIGYFHYYKLSATWQELASPAATVITDYTDISVSMIRASTRESYEDPTLNIGDSTVAGTNPATLMESLLSKNKNITTDAASFNLARTWYNDNGYFFNGWIPGENRTLETLKSICQQCRSFLTYHAGVMFLNVLKHLETENYVTSFGKNNSTIMIPNNDELNNDTIFSYELWVYVEDVPTTTPVHILRKQNDNIKQFLLTVDDSGNIKFTVTVFEVGEFSVIDVINLKEWVHIAITYGSNDLDLYVNGNNVDNRTVPAPIYIDNSNLYIGGQDGISNFNGMIDEFRIWNDVRTPAEIKDNMFKRLEGVETGLIGYYPFDDHTYQDKSINNNHGVGYGNITITPRNILGFNDTVQIYDSDGDPVTVEDSISINSQKYDGIVNRYNILYSADVTGDYQKSATVENTDDILINGIRDNTLDLYLITDDIMANDVADFWLTENIKPYTMITFTTFLEGFPLELGDNISLITEFSKLVSFTGRVVGYSRQFGDGVEMNGSMDLITLTVAGYPYNAKLALTGLGLTPLGIENLGI